MFKARAVLVASLAAAVTLTAVGVSPAQQPAPTRRVFNVSMTSWKFVPEIIQFNEGDTVVINLSNDDTLPRNHDITSAFFNHVDVKTVAPMRTGKTDEGRPFFRLGRGEKATMEFVARGRGTTAFLCSVFDHATRGMTGAFNVTAPGTMIHN
ncbi:MAG: hypothetical protein FJX78_05805 [Armatimonadetes bacterium]|nr:hypothetical protein [Armatimonadota bacterium]